MRLAELDHGAFDFHHRVADDPLRIGMAIDGLGAERLLREAEQAVDALDLQVRRHGQHSPGTCEGPALCVAMYQVLPNGSFTLASRSP